ncbi:hypothetical protein [Pantoea sp. SORGH_AS_0659]|uniref:hypothetical protein n=1 Tax=Pantoea sp. SORGH_AS_0659 TaxID=3062597 RepID=UPI002854AECB|nr:hypothetical protein [Pantoea sp. SORGH_AS_0659]MDR6352663.1 hypothetical protein [Pantoea sp. SORGH_AS_0659]
MDRKIIIHTLGPEGTNCEKAGYLWLESKKVYGDVKLYSTLEDALIEVRKNTHDLLLGCAVYPDLHKIVFENLDFLEIQDSFVMPTWNMVLAKNHRSSSNMEKIIIACHPARHPISLIHTARMFVLYQVMYRQRWSVLVERLPRV